MTGMMWGQHGDDGGPWGQHGVGTTWGPSGGYGDNVGMMGMTRG